MKITNPYGPNTTVLLPGGCNANCDFCFWNRDEAKITPPTDYLDKVFDTLSNLPEYFRALSVSGGEPTLSPMFGKFLARLGQYRRHHHLDRVVLTTHGGNLAPYVTAIGCVIDHLNISRHAIGSEANKEIFKSKKIPTDEELRELILKIHSETPVDVTLNCVVPEDVTIEFCYQFIEYAKDLGADAVSFRKIASEATPTEAELYFKEKYEVLSESKCPVCRGVTQNVNGFDVRWKGSVNEPSKETKGVYEAVIHPDGKLYADWSMEMPLRINKRPIATTRPAQPRYEPRYSYTSGGGCGSGGCGGRSGC